MNTRREIMLTGAGALGGALIGNLTNTTAVAQADKVNQVNKPVEGKGADASYHSWDKTYSGRPLNVKPLPPGLPGKDYQPVTVPNGRSLPFKIIDGVKVLTTMPSRLCLAIQSSVLPTCSCVVVMT